jgi:protein-S-isoprenylcysteine O-methyltransferase Ste14
VHPIFSLAFALVWGTTLVIWFTGMRRSKRAAHKISSLSRLILLIPNLLGYMLVALHFVRVGWLNLRLWPQSWALQAAGLVLTIIGCAFAIWARISLGRNWSARPSVREDHELIVRGPYKLVRHPIYTGLLLALAGSVLAVDRSGSILGWLLVFGTYFAKSRQEERLMLKTFPEDYPAYRRRVKALVPGVL